MRAKPIRTALLIVVGLLALTFPVWGPINASTSFAKQAVPCDPLNPLTCLTPDPTDTALPTLPTIGTPTLPPPLPLSACARALRGFATSCFFRSAGARLVVGGAQLRLPTVFIPPPPLIPIPLPDPLPTPIVTIPDVRIEIQILRLNGEILVECRGSGTLITACLDFGVHGPTGETLECRARWPGYGLYGCASYPASPIGIP